MKEKLTQFFCRHDYQIGVIAGVASMVAPIASSRDTAEIACFCSKCRKRFVWVYTDKNNNLIKVNAKNKKSKFGV